MEALKKDIEEYPDSYQYERAERFGASQSGIYWALKRLDVTYKKTLIHPKIDEEKRLLFQNKLNTYQANGMDIVYLDESGFANDMPRTHGYALKGQRVLWYSRLGRSWTNHVIGALLGERLLTVTLFQDTINTATFNFGYNAIIKPKN